jgi:hypothetical protein
MNKPRRAHLSRRTAIAAALTVATVVTGGGYAIASSNSTGHTATTATTATTDNDSLRYLVGSNVVVRADSAGWNAMKCPRGMYPVGGGPSSSQAVWEIQWSDADRSNRAKPHPDEWTVGLFNNSDSPATFKVFVVCSTASSVTGNY